MKQVSDARRETLLATARRSRVKWVLDAAKEDPDVKHYLQRLKAPKATATDDAGTDKGTEGTDEEKQIPAQGCVQTILDFLATLSQDGDYADIQSVVLSLESHRQITDGNDSSEDEDEELEKISGATETVVVNDDVEQDGERKGDNCPPFLNFLNKLRMQEPSMLELLRSTQQFCGKLSNEACIANSDLENRRTQEDKHREWAKDIGKFLEGAEALMKKTHVWSQGGNQEMASALEQLEKFVYLKLAPFILGNDNDDNITDDAFYQRMCELDFLTPEHLDIKSFKGVHLSPGEKDTSRPVWKTLLEKPLKHLAPLDSLKCPADIFKCLRNCTVSIAKTLKEARNDGVTPGADELLPMLILTLQQAKPRKIKSVLKFLTRYTSLRKMDSESGYLVTHFMSSMHFLDDLDASSLSNITSEEFDRALIACQAKSQETMNTHKAATRALIQAADCSGDEPSLPSFFSCVEEEEKSLGLLVAAEGDEALVHVFEKLLKKTGSRGEAGWGSGPSLKSLYNLNRRASA